MPGPEFPVANTYHDSARLIVFGRPEHPLDRVQRYMRKGLDQRIATLAAWGWVSFSREHNELAVDAAKEWGRAAELLMAELDVQQVEEYLGRPLRDWQRRWLFSLRSGPDPAAGRTYAFRRVA